MQEQKKGYSFDESIRNQLENHQSQVIKMCKRYYQQLEMELRQKDILLQNQKQRNAFEIQRYQRQLKYERQNNKLLLEQERENFAALLQQQRKRTQLIKQLMHKSMQKERQRSRQQMRRETLLVREECINVIKQNLRVQFSQQMQNISQIIMYEPESERLEKVIACIQRCLEKIKHQMPSQIKDRCCGQNLPEFKIIQNQTIKHQEINNFKKEIKQNENQLKNPTPQLNVESQESRPITQMTTQKLLIENKENENKENESQKNQGQFINQSQDANNLQQTISTYQGSNLRIQKTEQVQDQGREEVTTVLPNKKKKKKRY